MKEEDMPAEFKDLPDEMRADLLAQINRVEQSVLQHFSRGRAARLLSLRRGLKHEWWQLLLWLVATAVQVVLGVWAVREKLALSALMNGVFAGMFFSRAVYFVGEIVESRHCIARLEREERAEVTAAIEEVTKA